MRPAIIAFTIIPFLAAALGVAAHHHGTVGGAACATGCAAGIAQVELTGNPVLLAQLATEAVPPTPAAGKLAGKRVAILIAQGFHDGETAEPAEFVTRLGATVTFIGTEIARMTAYNSDLSFETEKTLAQVCVNDFDALIIPGGHSPRVLREDRNVRRFVSDFAATGKPIAAICHGPLVMVSAGILQGRTATGVGGIRGEVTRAGATFVDQAVVRDGNLITSRLPHDIPVFSEAIATALAEK